MFNEGLLDLEIVTFTHYVARPTCRTRHTAQCVAGVSIAVTRSRYFSAGPALKCPSTSVPSPDEGDGIRRIGCFGEIPDSNAKDCRRAGNPRERCLVPPYIGASDELPLRSVPGLDERCGVVIGGPYRYARDRRQARHAIKTSWWTGHQRPFRPVPEFDKGRRSRSAESYGLA